MAATNDNSNEGILCVFKMTVDVLALKPGEQVQLFRMKRDNNKGFFSKKCNFEAFGPFRALC